MSESRIRYAFDDRQAIAAIERLGGIRFEILRPIGLALVQVVQQRFRDEEDPFGRRWDALSPAYAEVKKGPGILRASGLLMRSITFEASGDEVAVGSNRVYAAVHQFGATIKPKNAKALVFKLGKRVVHAKSVTVPQRPYLGFGPEDRKAVLEVLDEAIEVAFSR